MAKTVKVGVLLRLATLSGLSWWLSGKKKKKSACQCRRV